MWIAIIIISIVGTLSHFIYDWSNHNKIVALFGAVNESTWEHIKIALTPTIIYSLYDGFIYSANPNYFVGKLISLISIIIVIPLIFYSYRVIAKKCILVIDISTFYIAIIVSQILFYYFLAMPELDYIVRYFAFIGLISIFGFYMTATLSPIKSFLFKDPITKKYGLKGHSEITKKEQ